MSGYEITEINLNEMPAASDNTNIQLLPRNWAAGPDGYEYPEITMTINKLLNSEKIDTNIVGYNDESKVQNHRAMSIVLPLIFISAAAIANNPELVTVTLNIVSNYLSEVFSGQEKNIETELSIAIET